MSSHVPKQISSELFNWKFEFQEGSLSPSSEIDQIAEKGKLFRAPSIVFGNNYCYILQRKHNFRLIFNAEEALKLINFETRKQRFRGPEDKAEMNTISYLPDRLKVKHAKKWETLQKPKDIEITEIQESSDSFFITPFKGHIQGTAKVERVVYGVIPIDKLGPENPIKFYQQGSIYEDELDDNGLIQYEYKFRSMESSWFALIRCYARVDDVALMILDTRIYWEEGWNKIARQFMVKKNTYDELKAKGFDFQPGWSMNPNQSHLVYQHMEEVFNENEYIHYV